MCRLPTLRTWARSLILPLVDLLALFVAVARLILRRRINGRTWKATRHEQARSSYYNYRRGSISDEICRLRTTMDVALTHHYS